MVMKRSITLTLFTILLLLSGSAPTDLVAGDGFPVAADFGRSGSPGASRAALEYNTGGAIDFVPDSGGEAASWGEWFVTTVHNSTGQKLILRELGFPCAGPPTGEFGWLVWTDVGGPGPPAGDPYTADHHGPFTPVDPNPATMPPTVYTYVDVTAEDIVIQPGSYFCLGYDVTGTGGQTAPFNGVDTWSWNLGVWNSDAGNDRTAILQVKADFLLEIPGDYTTLQDALDAAGDGYTILVAPDTYTGAGNKDLDFLTREIVLRSVDGPTTTIIDCEGVGRAFNFNDTPVAVVDGFTLVNCANDHGGCGGAIAINDSSPIFRNCRIIGSQNLAQGGAVGIIYSSAPLFEGCVITGCRGTLGGGVFVGYGATPTFSGCTIAGNHASTHGGGLQCNNDSEVSILRSVVWGNCADQDGDQLHTGEAASTIHLECSDVDNSGVEGSGTVDYVADNISIDPAFCDPVNCDSAPTALGNYTIDINSCCDADDSPCGELIGALGVGCDDGSSTYLAGFRAERTDDAAHLYWEIVSWPEGTGFHVWRREPGRELVRLSERPLSGSLVYEYVDPFPPSGEAEYWLEEIATDGTPTWYGPALLVAAPARPVRFSLTQNHPNPFNPQTTATFSLSRPGKVSLKIYDLRGKVVANLVEGRLDAGEHTVTWDGRDTRRVAVSSGVYLMRLETRDGIRNRKIVLAR